MLIHPNRSADASGRLGQLHSEVGGYGFILQRRRQSSEAAADEQSLTSLVTTSMYIHSHPLKIRIPRLNGVTHSKHQIVVRVGRTRSFHIDAVCIKTLRGVQQNAFRVSIELLSHLCVIEDERRQLLAYDYVDVIV